MLSMPFLILTGLGTYFYLLVRQARAQQAVALTAGQGIAGQTQYEATVNGVAFGYLDIPPLNYPLILT